MTAPETAIYCDAIVHDSLERPFLVHFKVQVSEEFDAELLPIILETECGSYGIEMQSRGGSYITMAFDSM